MKKSYLAPQISELGNVMALTKTGRGSRWSNRWGKWGGNRNRGNNGCNPVKPGGDSC